MGYQAFPFKQFKIHEEFCPDWGVILDEFQMTFVCHILKIVGYYSSEILTYNLSRLSKEAWTRFETNWIDQESCPTLRTILNEIHMLFFPISYIRYGMWYMKLGDFEHIKLNFCIIIKIWDDPCALPALEAILDETQMPYFQYVCHALYEIGYIERLHE